MEWPLSYEIDRSKCLVLVTYHEQPSFAQWMQTMDRIFADPAYHPQFGILLDRQKILRPAETEYIKQMVGYIDDRRTRGTLARWAILVCDIGSYGMGRMAEQLSSCTHSIRTFKQKGDAEMWLANNRGDPAWPQHSLDADQPSPGGGRN